MTHGALGVGAAIVLVAATTFGCASLPRGPYAGGRQADYLRSHPELTPEIARAIDTGHLLLGMNPMQVWVVLGDPLQKKRFATSAVEVWLYGPGRLHQDQLHSHGNDSFRVVFFENKLALIETI